MYKALPSYMNSSCKKMIIHCIYLYCIDAFKNIFNGDDKDAGNNTHQDKSKGMYRIVRLLYNYLNMP